METYMSAYILLLIGSIFKYVKLSAVFREKEYYFTKIKKIKNWNGECNKEVLWMLQLYEIVLLNTSFRKFLTAPDTVIKTCWIVSIA